MKLQFDVWYGIAFDFDHEADRCALDQFRVVQNDKKDGTLLLGHFLAFVGSQNLNDQRSRASGRSVLVGSDDSVESAVVQSAIHHLQTVFPALGRGDDAISETIVQWFVVTQPSHLGRCLGFQGAVKCRFLTGFKIQPGTILKMKWKNRILKECD